MNPITLVCNEQCSGFERVDRYKQIRHRGSGTFKTAIQLEVIQLQLSLTQARRFISCLAHYVVYYTSL